ncbi:MAG: four helix bundle protein [Ignavibacteriaceae bacterium]|nr:four helix bundle protein [Ignavibacteriaceae bacterium]
MKDNIIREKSFLFALRIVKLGKYLREEKRDFILSKQIIRSSTAIGALVRESEYAESKADFIHKMTIALKEANETEYWIELLYKSDYISEESYSSISNDVKELLRILIKIIKSTKASI